MAAVRLIAALALASGLAVHTAGAPTSALAADAPDGTVKINLSGRQRMLTQRMAKAACFAAIGVDAEAHVAMALDAHDLFDRTLAGLRDGDQGQGLAAETKPAILAELGRVEELWVTYGRAVRGIIENPGADGDLDAVAELSLPILSQMNVAVGAFEREYGAAGAIHPALAMAINISGRQRMLTQKASKEFCLIVAGVNVGANRTALGETAALFEWSLRALIDGDDEMGMPEAPTDPIYEQLQMVERLWAPLRATFQAVAGGATPSPEEIALVARDNNPLLVEMNAAVGMYADL